MILAYDIETTHLKANMGYILTAAAMDVETERLWKWRIDKQKGYRRDRPASLTTDKEMVKEIIETLTKAKVIITHYGTYFDIPFTNTRAIVNDLQPIPPTAHLDMWKIARKGLALTSNRQETILDLINSDHPKRRPGWKNWQLAMHGDKKAIKAISDYNVEDVKGLTDNYRKLRPLIAHHPRIRSASVDQEWTCRVCGGHHLHLRGDYVTKHLTCQRGQCQTCGTWDTKLNCRKG